MLVYHRGDKMSKLELSLDITSKDFNEQYYLKEELIAFCRQEGLPTTGGKIDISKRIAYYLDTRMILKSTSKVRKKTCTLSRTTVIIENLSYSEDLRAFFKDEIGDHFKFQVPFQKWLKSNVGKTYQDAINAYETLKKDPSNIDRQFEYNTYIRDFFQHTSMHSLKDAIRCWNYKKNIAGNHKFEISDLEIL